MARVCCGHFVGTLVAAAAGHNRFTLERQVITRLSLQMVNLQMNTGVQNH